MQHRSVSNIYHTHVFLGEESGCVSSKIKNNNGYKIALKGLYLALNDEKGNTKGCWMKEN